MSRESVLDPRTKLVLALAFGAMVVFTPSPAALGLEFAAAALLTVGLGLSRAWLQTLRALGPALVFLFVVMWLSFDLASALAGVLRLASLATAFLAFFRTTAPEDLANALVKMGIPYVFAFILTTAMQFVPVITRQMQDTIDAQRSRGIRLEPDWHSVRNYPALFAPLLVQSFTLADRLAEAMEARGFGTPHRTFQRDLRLRPLDYAAFGAALVLVLITFRLR